MVKNKYLNIYLFLILIIFNQHINVQNARLRSSKIHKNINIQTEDKEGLTINLKKIHIPIEKQVAFLTKLQTQISTHKTSFIQSKKYKSNNKAIIPLSLIDEVQFIGQIEIGTPRQPLSVIFDTGSGNILILSNRCKSDICKNTASFKHNLSNTYTPLGDMIEIDFVSGGISGQLSKDDISIGGITIPQQSFGEILNEEGNIFQDAPFSGIVGLGYPDLAIPGINPVLDSLMKGKSLKKNIIGFSFNKEGGKTTFGYVDKNAYKGKIDYYKVIDKYYWTIEIKDIQLNGKSLGYCKDKICKAAIDTGTSLIAGPSDELNTLLNKILVDDYCIGIENAPVITFIFDNGKKYDLEPEDYILEFKQNDIKQCKALMMPVDVEEPHGPLWILGVLFMQKYYTVFDRDNNRVGFALANN